MLKIIAVFFFLSLGLTGVQQIAIAQSGACRVISDDIVGYYDGDCKNGLANGRGKSSGKNSYEGFFFEGKPHGTGIYTSSSGNRYEGEFRDGKPNGKGTFYYSSGDRIDGQMRDGRLLGDGILTRSNGQRLVVNDTDGKIVISGGGASNQSSASSSTLTWELLLDFDDLFPSYIITTSTMKTPNALPPNYLGDPHGTVGISVRSTLPNTKIRGMIEIDQIAERTEFSYTLPTVGQYRIYPKIKFRYQQLANIRQPITVNVSFSVAEEGARPETKTQSVRVRAINDAVLSNQLPDGRMINKEWTLAGFVNEITLQLIAFCARR